MFDVLEHLENPVNFFKDANVKLKSGGYILAYTKHPFNKFNFDG